MQEKVNEIINMLEQDIICTKNNSEEPMPVEYFNELNKIIKLNNKQNAQELLKLTNYEVFKVFFIATNLLDSTYNELNQICMSLENIINNWNFQNDFSDIYYLATTCSIDDEKLPKDQNFKQLETLCLKKLVNYKLKFALMATAHFLHFKKENHDFNAARNIFLKKSDNTFTITSNIKFVFDNLEKIKRILIDIYKSQEEYDSKSIKYSEELLKILKGNGLADIETISDEWHQYISPDILYELLIALNENLNDQYSTILIEKEIIESIIKKTPLSSFLYELGIDINKLDSDKKELLEKENIENLKQRFNLLIKIGFSINSIIKLHFNLLTDISPTNIKNINMLLETKAIAEKTLIDNPDLMTKSFSSILTNYEILKPIIDFNNIHYNDNILTISPLNLKNILSILAEYNLTPNNYMFLLCNFKYINIYDAMLENEIPLYLLINICNTKNPIQTIKRIIYCKEVGTPFETPSHTLRRLVVDDTKFVCDDETINEYYPSFESLRLPHINGEKIVDVKNDIIVQELEKNNRIEDCYFVGDAIIARPKFLKKYQQIKDDNNINRETLISCFLDDSIVTEAKYYSITDSAIKKSYL